MRMTESIARHRTQLGPARAWLLVISAGIVSAASPAWGQTPNYVGKFSTPTTLINSLIVDTGSNVGIGTTSPSTLFHVSGASYDLARFESSLPFSGLSIKSAGHQYELQSDQFNSFMLYDRTNAAQRLTVTSAGNVGIGTTTPCTTVAPTNCKLSVNGAIQAKEIVVNTGWSDYVFRPGYRLRPLSEVNAFIQAHHHLPEIPSEAEVQEKGIGVGEMQSKLLAKVEELTLHMIRAEEENKALRERVARLEGSTAR